MSEKTHEEALEIAVEYGAGYPHDLEHMMREYMKARDLVMVPKEPTHRMTVYGHAALDETQYTQTKALGSLMGRMAFVDVYLAMLAAAPDPFDPSP